MVNNHHLPHTKNQNLKFNQNGNLSLDSFEQCIQIQNSLKDKVSLRSVFSNISDITSIGCVSVFFKDNTVQTAVVILDFPELKVKERIKVTKKVKRVFPYMPGLLFFREGEFILNAIDKIKALPSLFIFNASGICHPRRVGLASHIGVILNIPTIGVTKSLLYGNYEEPLNIKGVYTFLKNKEGEILGVALRTKKDRKHIFVSIGNKIDLAQSIDVVLKCTKDFRLPEPIRLAVQVAKGIDHRL